MSNFIFGYGSLIDHESRLMSLPKAAEVIPVKANGLSRGWWARTKVNGFSTTYLGCLNADSPFLKNYHCAHFINGVIFKVTDAEMLVLDEREKNYNRVRLQNSQLEFYDKKITLDSPVWVYLNRFANSDELLQSLPCKDFPIVQSYVDVCINGCIVLELAFQAAKEKNFIRDFMHTTSFWSEYWANDRIFPRRPHVHCRNAFAIDSILKEYLPDKSIFDRIYIE
ncbi:MAG: gamma-glutamylcyclotransferase family protein [Agriterribacter sp.]